MDDGEVIDLAPTPKRLRLNASAASGAESSPSKKRKLEEDGLVLMDGENDQLVDDIIEID